MAAHRAQERRHDLTNVKSEHHREAQRESANAAAAGKVGPVDNNAPVVSCSTSAELNREASVLAAVTSRMLQQMDQSFTRRRQQQPVAGDTISQLLPSFGMTWAKVLSKLPKLSTQLGTPTQRLCEALAFATVLADGGDIDAIGDLATVLEAEAVRGLRLRVLHMYMTKVDPGDSVATAPASVIRAALTIPHYRTALADRAGNVERAVMEWRGAPSSSNPDRLQRMSGVVTALFSAKCQPATLLQFLRGLVAPILLPQLDHSVGCPFDHPSQMHQLLYLGTMQPEYKKVAAAADDLSEKWALEAVRLDGTEDGPGGSNPGNNLDEEQRVQRQIAIQRRRDALMRDAVDMKAFAECARTLLYRVLLSVEHLIDRRRSLGAGSVLITSAVGSSSSSRNGGGNGSSGSAGGSNSLLGSASAAHSHRTLLQLIDHACRSNGGGVAVEATDRRVDGHDVYEIAGGGTADDATTLSFYLHQGVVFAATHRQSIAPNPGMFKKIAGGAVELLTLARR